MRKHHIAPGCLLMVLLIAHPASAGTVAGLEVLKTLVGKWKGTFQWSGARTDSGAISAEYSLTGNRTGVVENLMQGGETMMSSIYHADGEDLRMTHYCGAGNQPRLRAHAYTQNPSTLKFAMVDITNLAAPDAGHVEAVELILHSKDQIQIKFTFVGNGKESIERIDLRRVE